MSGPNIRVTVTRACLLGGVRVEAGSRLELSALDAADLLDAGKGTLVNEADLLAVLAARRAETAAMLRRERTPPAFSDPYSDPHWQQR